MRYTPGASGSVLRYAAIRPAPLRDASGSCGSGTSEGWFSSITPSYYSAHLLIKGGTQPHGLHLPAIVRSAVLDLHISARLQQNQRGDPDRSGLRAGAP